MRIHKITPQTSELTLAKVRLIARLKGDGSVFRSGRNKTIYWLKYEVSNYDDIRSFADDIKEVYGLEPKFCLHRSGKNPNKLLPVVFVRSKLAYQDITKYGPYNSREWIVPDVILNGSYINKVEFIKAFAEDEGTVTSNQVRIYSINFTGLKQISDMLVSFNIENRIIGGFGASRNVYAIVISKKKHLSTFAGLIGFRSDRKNNKLKELLK